MSDEHTERNYQPGFAVFEIPSHALISGRVCDGSGETYAAEAALGAIIVCPLRPCRQIFRVVETKKLREPKKIQFFTKLTKLAKWNEIEVDWRAVVEKVSQPLLHE